jgi:peptidoglycan/xylan/chitin deacetylase (PgdA/CDA1 family)
MIEESDPKAKALAIAPIADPPWYSRLSYAVANYTTRGGLAGVCDRIGATGFVLGLRRSARASWLPVLTFHRVTTVPDSYRFDADVIDTTPAEFEKQLEVLRGYFTPIGIDEVVRFVDGGSLPNNPVLVTFDDGYRDNRETALPILQRFGVKAVFFIATDYVTRRRVFWWDRLNYLIKSSPLRTLSLKYPPGLTFSLRDDVDRRRTIKALLRLIKRTAGLDLEQFLTQLANSAGVDWTQADERRFADELIMTWQQIRELRAAGMDVQSHTRTHRVLQTLSPEQVIEEIEGSHRDLERELGERACALSYPVGHTINDRDDVRAAMRRAGYKIGFTNATGTQPLSRGIDPYSVNRIGLDIGTPAALFKAMLAIPRVFD